MKIGIASDHAALGLKNRLRDQLREWGHAVEDLGTTSTDPVDYPDFAHILAGAVQRAELDRGVLICGTGLGMSMAANRHRGIGVRADGRADSYAARMSRLHNDANVLCLGARILAPEYAIEVLRVFLDTPYEGTRHVRRVAKIELPEGQG
jgi:ribose 5-phosphate isomerase B